MKEIGGSRYTKRDKCSLKKRQDRRMQRNKPLFLRETKERKEV